VVEGRPALGYPDQIVVRMGGTAGAAFAAVQQGRADAAVQAGPITADRLSELRARSASQLHTFPSSETIGFFFNTRLAPFNDVKVRRALNYAADRAAAVNLVGGADAGQPTCQILPPDLPGYKPYCPYSAGPVRVGRWRAPDLAVAQRLVAASGTRGMKVTVVVYRSMGLHDLGAYAVRLLRSLGYRASERVTSSPDTSRVQIGSVAWVADYPAASNFLTPLPCGSWSQFCDPVIDRRIQRAHALEVSNPVAANRLWARVDHRLVDEAAWLPLVTPKTVDFLGKGVANYENSPVSGMLIDQLWVR
jgi:peptide/nickel transport system substrate-binding protein